MENLHNQWDKLLQEGIYFPGGVESNAMKWAHMTWWLPHLTSFSLESVCLFLLLEIVTLPGFVSVFVLRFSSRFTRFTQPETDSKLKDKIRLYLWCSSVGIGWQVSKTEISGWMRFGARSKPTRPVHSTNDNQEMLIAFREYISTIKITWTWRENSPCKHYLQLSKYFRGTPPRGKYKENKSKLLLIPTIPIS